MTIQRISISQFLAESHGHLVIDVRSPLEYQHGHIPGAKNIALFTDSERSIVGTLYKHRGKQTAILQGLQLVGPKLANFIKAVQSMTDKPSIFVYCARGGMRSSSFAWLLHTFGYQVFVLESGYKAYRNFVLQQFCKSLRLIVLSGKTGTGKTQLLHRYHAQGQQVIDLEGLACHKGSVFGGIGQQIMTQEQFENNLGLQIASLDSNIDTWIEDESRHIGKIMIPAGLWHQMRLAPIHMLEKSVSERIAFLLDEYQHCSNLALKNAVQGLSKHMGLERCLKAQQLLDDNKRYEFCAVLLEHYDRLYDFSFKKRIDIKFNT